MVKYPISWQENLGMSLVIKRCCGNREYGLLDDTGAEQTIELYI